MDKPTRRHLTDEELVAELDREVPAGASQTAHLEGCWSCRTRLDELESAMHGFIRLRDDVLLAAPEPPPMWPGLEAGMDRIDAEGSGQSLWTRMRRKATASWSARVAVAASVILMLVIAGATPAAAARAVRDAIRFIGSLVTSEKSATPPLGRDVKRAHTDIQLPALPLANAVSAKRSATAVPPLRSPVNLVDLELEALWQLHRVGALVGEEVVIDRTPRALAVQVRVEDAERKAQVREALAPVVAGGARVQVQTYAEATARKPAPAAPRVAYQELGAVADRSAAATLLAKHFGAQFGSESDPRVTVASREFSSSVLGSARQITLYAFALRRLSERSESVLSEASAPAQATYRVLVREYAGGMEARAAELIRDLQSVFGVEPHGEPTEAASAGAEATAAPALRLEDEVRAAFAVQTGVEALGPVDGARLLRLARSVERAAAAIRRSNSH